MQAAAVRTCRRALVAGAVAFALVGALTTPPHVVLVFAPMFGIFVGTVVALVNPAYPRAHSARRAAVLSGTSATLAVPCLAGIGQFGAAGTVPAVVLMLLGCVTLGGWSGEHSDPSVGGTASRDAEELRQFVQALPTSMLLIEWRAAGEHVQPGVDPNRWAAGVLVRDLLLEELSRRDPVGVARWLSEGEQEAPEQYLLGDSDATP